MGQQRGSLANTENWEGKQRMKWVGLQFVNGLELLWREFKLHRTYISTEANSPGEWHHSPW